MRQVIEYRDPPQRCRQCLGRVYGHPCEYCSLVSIVLSVPIDKPLTGKVESLRPMDGGGW